MARGLAGNLTLPARALFIWVMQCRMIRRWDWSKREWDPHGCQLLMSAAYGHFQFISVTDGSFRCWLHHRQVERWSALIWHPPLSLFPHPRPFFFYWWSNLQWGDKGSMAFSINALIRAQQALQHLSDWQPRYSGFCRHPLSPALHGHTHTHGKYILMPLAFALTGFHCLCLCKTGEDEN